MAERSEEHVNTLCEKMLIVTVVATCKWPRVLKGSLFVCCRHKCTAGGKCQKCRYCCILQIKSVDTVAFYGAKV